MTSILNYLPKIKINSNSAAFASLGIATLILGIMMENARIQEFGCYLLIASGIAMSHYHFFQTYKPEKFETPLENHIRQEQMEFK